MPTRRQFFTAAGATLAAACAEDRRKVVTGSWIEDQTPKARPGIAVCHLGFVPKARKLLVFRASGEAPKEVTLLDRQHPLQFSIKRPLTRFEGDLGECYVCDFTSLEREGMYQANVGEERGVPFFIRPDVWLRTLPKAVNYFHQQRCGMEVPYVHPACHLDDGKRSDTGEHVDVSGGWHDDGAVRKWMSYTMTIAIGLLHLARNLGGKWNLAHPGVASLLDEIQWGNRYFLKMQDRDGLVWANTAAGFDSLPQQRWTDNKIGNQDDRRIDVCKSARMQVMFVAIQAMAAQAFAKSDRAYAKRCLDAGVRCWNAFRAKGQWTTICDNVGDDSAEQTGSALLTAMATVAAVELWRATRARRYMDEAAALARELLNLQVAGYSYGQNLVRGFWQMAAADRRPFWDPTFSAYPPLALCELLDALPDHPDAGKWRGAVRMHVDDYVLPMCARSAFGILPLSLYLGSPTPELYRPLGGELTYRYFMWTRRTFWWQASNSHLESYAIVLARAARLCAVPQYREHAYRQLEWVLGANPFGASLMIGEGWRNPYPMSLYSGVIDGAIIAGVAGNSKDEPVLDTDLGFEWRTNEQWSPQNAYYVWAVSAIERT